jgi:hypothetical protein
LESIQLHYKEGLLLCVKDW